MVLDSGRIRTELGYSESVEVEESLRRTIAWLSSIHTLHPGDIVALGTNHRGLHAFMDGDRIELEVDGLGRLTFKVKDALKRTWARDTRLEHAQKGGEGVSTPQTGGKYAKKPEPKPAAA